MAHRLRFATYLAPNMYPVYQFIVQCIGEKLDYVTELVVGTDFRQMEDSDIDLAFLCGLPYVLLTRQHPPPVEALVAPVLQGTRYQGRPIYYSDVVVRRDSPYQSFADLRGRTWAYNEPDSHSGYGITRYWLVKLNETGGYFGKVVEAGFHQRSIRLVASGDVDASGIDSQVLAVELRDHPELAEQLRVIDSLGPSSIQPLVAMLKLPDNLKADLVHILVDMDKDPLVRERLNYGYVERFVEVDDAIYDDIREMLAATEAVGFLTLK